MKVKALFVFVMIPFLCACQSMVDKAVRNAKYSAYEVVGVEKRDLFKREVTKVKESQIETGEAFTDALDQLKAVYKFDGGNLEKEYRRLNSSYEDAREESEEVKERIQKLEAIAEDIFTEWKEELKEISSDSLRSKSTATLAETQKKYADYRASLKKSEAKIDPVLTKFRDQVLFLKHNLNAKAIVGLKSESNRIEGDIESLIQEMNSSIKHGEEFIKTIQ